MQAYDKKPRFQSTFNVLCIIIIIIVCCGEFVRIELVLNEQHSRIQELENIILTSTPKERKANIMNTNYEDKVMDNNNQARNRPKRALRSCHHIGYCLYRSSFYTHEFPELKAQFNVHQSRYENFVSQVSWFGHLRNSIASLVQRKPTGEQGATGQIGPPGPKGEPGLSFSPPAVTISPRHLRVLENSSVIIRCSATGSPLPATSWRKANESLESERFHVDSNGSLRIDRVTPVDTGKYICEASSILGKAKLSARLEVRFPPRAILDQGPVYRNIGKTGILPTCHVTGNPKPKITWSKVKGDLPRNRTVIVNGQLSLANPLKSDSGWYICKAENSLGSVTVETMVLFVNLPEFTTTPNEMYNVLPGSELALSCAAKGSQQPVISWVKDKSNLPALRHSVKDGKLVLFNVTHADAGTYKCIASGEVTIKAKTLVKVITSVPKDCAELYTFGIKHSGLYNVKPDGEGPFQVYCDMATDGGGWTVFQRRQDGSVKFDRSWKEYKQGFGNLFEEFWLGNSYIHRLTSRTRSSLRLDLEDYVGWKSHTKFGSFEVGSEDDKYKLKIDDLSGTVGISFVYNNNSAFSTKDQDNDKSYEFSCARSHGNTGWWYSGCGYTNLNGIYTIPKGYNTQGVLWGSFDSYRLLRRSEMKMRPLTFMN